MASHEGYQNASSSITGSRKLCWKCQALLNVQPSAEVVCKEEQWRDGEDETLSRTLETSEDLDKTAQEGCALCQRLLQSWVSRCGTPCAVSEGKVLFMSILFI